MLKIYGSDLCKDCVECKSCLDSAGIPYKYCSITENLIYMKEFLSIRENNPVFEQAKSEGYIGIPCLICDDNTVLLDWTKLL